MDQEEQTQCVKTILDLELEIQRLHTELMFSDMGSFEKEPVPPEAPVHEHFESEYPEVRSSITANWLVIFAVWVVAFVLAWLFPTIGPFSTLFIAIPILLLGTVPYLIMVGNKQREDVKRIEESEEHKALIAKIDAETAQKQADADEKFEKESEQYSKDMTEFEEVTLPGYQRRLREWEEEIQLNQKMLSDQIASRKDELLALYTSSRLIPTQYRNIRALEFLYDVMSSSSFDVHQAIDNYEKHLARELQKTRLEEQRQANALLEEQTIVAEKARRDQNIAAAVNAMQQHKRNNMMKREYEARANARKGRR